MEQNLSYKITVKGTARTEYHDPKKLAKLSCSDCFSEYLNDETIKQKGLCGGYMHFEWVESEKKLYTVTVYHSEQPLSAVELERLKKYTQGQWSDGIGEGFEQFPRIINGEEVYLSPWHSGQIATITQEEINNEYF